MSGLPVLGEVRLQVLVPGVEELDELCSLGHPRVAAQELVTVLLQELEAQHGPGGALLLAAVLQLLVLKGGEKRRKIRKTGRHNWVSEELHIATHNQSHLPRNLGIILSDFFSLLVGGNSFFICFCNEEATEWLKMSHYIINPNINVL